MLRRLYDWCIDAADKPYAVWILGMVSFAESSFFPVPPDVMLIPMSLAQPRKAWLFALVCTITSVAGGVLGYAIGALLYDSIGGWIIQLYGYGNKMDAFRESYAEWGAMIILIKGTDADPLQAGDDQPRALPATTCSCSSCCRSSPAGRASSCSRSCSIATDRRRARSSRSVSASG